MSARIAISVEAAPDVSGRVGILLCRREGNSARLFHAIGGAPAVLEGIAASRGFIGDPGQALAFMASPVPHAERLVLVGCGPEAALDALALRKAGAAAARILVGAMVESAALLTPLDPEHAAWFAEGFLLGGDRGERDLKTKPEPAGEWSVRALVLASLRPAEAEARVHRCLAMTEATLGTRSLANRPANLLGPDELERVARDLSAQGIGVEVLDAKALEKAGCGLLLAVGRAAAQKPRLIILRWPGARSRREDRALTVIGKGITFDTGGICIKPAGGMEAMKGDMAGAAAVLRAVETSARMGHAAPLTGVLAVAENAIGADAFRPGDVLTACDGTTVEVIDTDAEGRLVLADAIAMAARTLDPAAIVTIATLTGAMVTTLGRHRAGLFATDDRLRDALMRAGAATEQALWSLPFSAALAADLVSPIADIRQCAPAGGEGWAGRLLPDAHHAALFLREFVAGGIPFAHLDIAGVSRVEEDWTFGPKGATGFGAALLAQLAETWG